MMDQHQTDICIKKLFARSQPVIDETRLLTTICASLPTAAVALAAAGGDPSGAEIGSQARNEGPAKGTRHGLTVSRRRDGRRPARRLAFGALVVVVLAAVGLGIYTLVERVGRDDAVVVITDDPMQPGSDAAVTPTVELPPGVSQIIGQTEHSIWCLSAKDGLRSVEVGAAGPGPVGGYATRVAVGRQGRRVAYVLRQEGEVFLWDTTKQGDDAVTELEVGDPSHLVDIFMSPDETKLLVMRFEITDPALDGGIRHDYLVDLDTGKARAWHWSEDDQMPGELTKLVWNPSSDALYASFGPAGGSQGTTTHRYELATGDWGVVEGIAAVRDVNAQGVVVGLTEGPAIMHEGMGASDAGSLPVAIWSKGAAATLPHMSGFALWDGAWVSADGNSVVVLGRTTGASGGGGALEIIRRGDGGWAADRVLTGSREIGGGLGFLGGDRFYFTGGWPTQDETFLGQLDPVTGAYEVYDELPVPDYSRILGVSLAETAGDGSGPTDATGPPATTRDTGDTTTSTVTPFGPPLIGANVTVSGPATITRPEPDYVLLTATLGSEQPQFGLQADGLWAPGGLAVSPDGGTFAIADGVNSRMKVFTGGGMARAILMNTIPAPEGHDLGGDVVMDGEGNIYVLGHSFQTLEVLRFHLGDDQVETYPIAETLSPSRLFLEGENLWVQGADQKSYPVAGIGPTLSPEWYGEKLGAPTGGYVVAVTSAKSPTVSIEVSSPEGEPRKLFDISSPDLHIAYADILGTDSMGNLYVRLDLQPTEDWMGTASQLIVALSPAGEKIGELRLPYDGYIGSGQIRLGADGTVYELLTTQEELSVVAHSLKTD